MENYILLLPIIIPTIIGLGLLIGKEPKKKSTLLWITGTGLIFTAFSVFYILSKDITECTLFYLVKSIPIYFHLDEIGQIFVIVLIIVWVLAGFYGFTYMKHEERNKRYFGFYLIVFGVLIALDLSGNMITFYIFYELMTVLTTPLVFHTQTKEAVMAGLKYMFYSFSGAYMVLFGIYFLNRYGTSLNFVPGGVLDINIVKGNEGIVLIAAFFMIFGFSVKAGMFPMHAWLPTAHPIAPAPASAVLSAMITKMGVLGIIRSVYYLFGSEFIQGTWVQNVWLILTLITVFMGSMLAYWEKGLKKRLAYSTVSQVSYILFGLALCEKTAFTGSVLHFICHAFIKATLFLCAGAIIYETGKTKVEELTGIGKQMPVTLWCYTFASLALIGIPPTGGFISKWYLAEGSLKSGLQVFSWLGPVILLTSALLTAGYLLPVTVNGFLPGKDYPMKKKKEPAFWMLGSIFVCALAAVGIGILPNPVINFITQITEKIF